ncbi:hypothetical protein [Synechococcus sp. PCC 7336]|uniref:hypothetical protein n=1 Tax=Synechococcus sp. PCC 7336 TaxID=195250 RepID=UPI000347E1C8|nr:hypothetical protein [Synechococcus sp. PCC 7336]
MYTIELTIKGSSAILAVQRKEEQDAEKVYRQVVDAIAQGKSGILELSCERTEKKATVLIEQIAAVQLTPKTSKTGATGSRAGFFAQLEDK